MESIPTNPQRRALSSSSTTRHSVDLDAVNSRPRRRIGLYLLAGFFLFTAGAGIGFYLKPGRIVPVDHHTSTVLPDKGFGHDDATIPLVKIVKPKQERSAEIYLERLATIEPYYRADLRTRASGIVKVVHHDIGDEVKCDEVLIEIDVPESIQDVANKRAVIVQRELELKVSEAKAKDAQAMLGVTRATITQREADAQSAKATRDLKRRRFERYQDLATRGSVVGSVVEEEERDYLASEAMLSAATANVARAQADHAETVSKVATAAADIQLKQSQIDVAKTELERALVVANYSRVIAPFDGVVVKRNVDAGSFVQNATTGASETLISVSRIDLVTVTAQFPDNAAASITRDTPASIQITDFSGGSISSKVTRFSPTIQNSDRTMRVEVDLFNGGAVERDAIVELRKSGKVHFALKGDSAIFPDPAFVGSEQSKRLLPGMNASLRLAIGGAGTSYVLPSTAVYSKSGAKCILVVVNGQTQSLPVRVQINDGQRVRVVLVNRKISNDGTAQEDLSTLTGDEEVVVTGQLQVGEGVQVRVSPVVW